MAKLISKTYGEALFELALEENKLDDYLEEATMALKIIRENPEFSAMMQHPRIDRDEKVNIVENVFGPYLSREVTGLLRLIVQKDRYSEAKDILEWFIAQVKSEKGIGQASVVSAVALTDAQQRKIKDRLLETTSFKEMEMDFSVDPALIGGLKIRIGDRVVDSSISSKLDGLKSELMKVQLA